MSKFIIHIIISMAFSAAILLCSCKGGAEKAADGHIPDPEATEAGIRAARSVINLRSDESAMNDTLLEIRAEIYSVYCDKGPVAASDFEEAFEKYIRENCDSLARVLL